MRENARHMEENAKPRKVSMPFAFLFLLLALGVPALCRYQPPLVGVTGYKTHLVTDPGYFGSPLRALQSFWEMQPCAYSLHGWDEEERLYYTAVCSTSETQWRYEPARGRRKRVDVVPGALHVEAADRDEVLDRVRAAGVRPTRHEPYTRPILLHDSGFVSLSGRYMAVITRRIYSVHDVVVLEKEG